MARRLELDPPRLSGDPAVVAEGVAVATNSGYGNFSVSANGTLFYGRGTGMQKARFTWRDRKGNAVGTVGEPSEGAGTFQISPDQSRVAYSAVAANGERDIWILQFARGLSARFTFKGGRTPHWSPDGRHLFYVGQGGIYRKSADGAGEEEVVLKGPLVTALGGVSPDGKYLLYDDVNDIWKLPLTGERKPAPYLRTEHPERGAAVSPDGRWVAYESNESGSASIYVQGFPERQGKWLVSAGGGLGPPAWRADGKELYWRSSNRKLMAAAMDFQAGVVRPGKPEPLFDVSESYFAPARDGKRFLVLEPEGGTQPNPPMVVVLNWTARLGK
jgi:Tol biopolymer transport system component